LLWRRKKRLLLWTPEGDKKFWGGASNAWTKRGGKGTKCSPILEFKREVHIEDRPSRWIHIREKNKSAKDVTSCVRGMGVKRKGLKGPRNTGMTFKMTGS